MSMSSNLTWNWFVLEPYSVGHDGSVGHIGNPKQGRISCHPASFSFFRLDRMSSHHLVPRHCFVSCSSVAIFWILNLQCGPSNIIKHFYLHVFRPGYLIPTRDMAQRFRYPCRCGGSSTSLHVCWWLHRGWAVLISNGVRTFSQSRPPPKSL